MTATRSTTAFQRRRNNGRSSRPKIIDLIVPILAIGGLYWFAASFFLAKKSLSDVSICEEAQGLLQQYLGLSHEEASLVLKNNAQHSTGCWLNRRVDTLVILVVDALRFDFARYELPQSIGARIDVKNTTSSQLLQFVADPPTVTMQRLKGLTTGGLPTFADISGNFGGAAIDEDSWVQQLVNTPYEKRGLEFPSRRGFVGDDTWVDLFPTQFQDSFPYPSFNTRDLDTVDNGCLQHLPGLLGKLRKVNDNEPDRAKKEEELEVLVAHFLGVDHVGHTYGPHNEHMTQKLNQIDAALATTLEILDESQDCHLALVFGDHGMTEDGNHGGGTEEEINAALFAHFSPACGAMPLDLTPQTGSRYVEEVFQSIHQIDLVPTISVLLGLPIPYANIGGIAPSLLGLGNIRETASALALNAAQVWRYFSVYSSTANKLPNLPELEERLKDAVTAYKEALAHLQEKTNNSDDEDSNAFYTACGLFKIFLVEASELGHSVWTRFDTFGMIMGSTIVFVALVASIASLYFEVASTRITPSRQHILEIGLTTAFGFFQICMLSFSNSYIEAEQGIVMFMMSVICIIIFVRINGGAKAGGNARIVPYVPLLVPLLSRISESVVTGHGLDPSIRLHMAHSQLMFIPSLIGLIGLRLYLYSAVSSKSGRRILPLIHSSMDCLFMMLLGMSWLEKRTLDQSQNGFFWAKGCVALLVVGIPAAIFDAMNPPKTKSNDMAKKDGSVAEDSGTQEFYQSDADKSLAIISKLLLALMLVTGPATGSSVLIVVAQGWMLFVLGGATGFYEVRDLLFELVFALVIVYFVLT